MATKLFDRLTDVRGMPLAGQSSPVRINVPTIGRLLNIKGNVTKAGVPATLAEMKLAIGEVRFILNTEVVRKLMFAEYLAMLEANGFINEDGLFPYYFAEPWRAQVADEELLSLALGGRYANAALDFDLAQPAVALDFDMAHEYDLQTKVMPPGTPQAGQPILGILGHTVQVENLGAGVPRIVINPFEGALQRMWVVVPATVNVNRVRIIQGQTAFYDRWNTIGKPEIERSLKDSGMVMPANFTTAQGTFKMVPIILDNNQRISNNITNTAGLVVELTLDTPAPTTRLIIEQAINR